MLGPHGEYLEGAGAISGNAEQVGERLKKALQRWRRLRREKDYANEDVPAVTTGPPPEFRDKPLVLRVFLRDLPRGKGDDSGRRFTKADLRGMWLDFTQWAWNVNWFAADDPEALVTKSRDWQPVESALFRRLARQTLVDNVRGQNPHWQGAHVQAAELRMRRIEDDDAPKGTWTIEYAGRAELRSDRQSFTPTLHGRAVWLPDEKRFESLRLVAVGTREGAGTFNQRGNDPGPAPMGVLLELFAPPTPEPE